MIRLAGMCHSFSVITSCAKSINSSVALVFKNAIYHYILDGAVPEHKGFALTQKSCFEPFVVKCGLDSFDFFDSLRGSQAPFKKALETLRTKFARSMTNDFDNDFDEEENYEEVEALNEGYRSEELAELLREYDHNCISML